MPLAKILLTAYGVLLILGGFMGFKAGSKVSLIMGSLSGILTLFSLYMATPPSSYRCVALISGILCIVFIIRLIKTHQFMPSGGLLILSLAALLISISQIK